MKATIISIAAAAMLAAGCTKVDADATKNNTEMSALKAIATRKSVRKFDFSKPIDSGTIEKLLRSAMCAPTAMNKQPWAFVVVQDEATLAKLFETHPHARKSPLVICVCGTDNGLDGAAKDYWVQDCSAATENLLLAAHAMGLGAVWCGVYPIPERIDGVREVLSISSGAIPFNLICIGYPAVNPEPKDKWDPAKVHTNRW